MVATTQQENREASKAFFTVRMALVWAFIGMRMGALSAAGANLVTATNNGNWSAAATWSNGIPQPGDDVVIPAGRTVTNDVQTDALGSLTNNGLLVFTGTNHVLTAASIAVNGTITHVGQSATNPPWAASHCVSLVCSDLFVAASGKIDVSGKGYGGGPALTNGYGLGGGIWASNNGGGGGYGGAGGAGNNTPARGGTPYGSAELPLEPGSGAAGSYSGNKGGAGGGLVWIEATNIVLNGGIIATGVVGSTSAGGGSGGGISIRCRTLTGSNGLVLADGALALPNANGGGGGGGGRIAVYYDTQAESNLTSKPSGLVLSANGGLNAEPTKGRGEPGTIRLLDDALLSDGFRGGQLLGVSSWAAGRLAFTNASVYLPNGFSLSVTNDVNLSFSWFRCTNANLRFGASLTLSATSSLTALSGPSSTFTVGSNLTLNLSSAVLTNGTPTDTPDVTIGGALVMTNAGRLYVYSAMTNGVAPDYGALVTVSGGTFVANASWIYPFCEPTNGGSPLFRFADLSIGTANAGFNGNAGGYEGGANNTYNGYGPGKGISTNNCGGGGAYGGNGGNGNGNGSGAPGGVAYGDALAPLDPGSGGGGGFNTAGARGGALVRLVASNVTVNGSILANGGVAAGYSGGGAGGGIHIVCRTFTGTNGIVSANGGTVTPNVNGGGGGGGGRIAIVCDAAAQSNLTTKPSGMVFSANGGVNAGMVNYLLLGWNGRPGTIHLPDSSLLSDGFQGGQVLGVSSWSPGAVTLSNAVAVFPSGFSLRVTNDVRLTFSELLASNAALTIGGDLALHATSSLTAWSGPGYELSVAGNLALNLSSVILTNGTSTNAPGMSVGGDLVMTNVGRLYVYSAATNAGAANCGALVSVTGTIVLANSSWVYAYSNPTNGGSPYFNLGNLNIQAANSGFDASARGYRGGNAFSHGYGPGYGSYTNNVGGGGGYGGVGGYGFNGTLRAAGGTNYGSMMQPSDPGSGGAGSYNAYKGGPGGGLLRIDASNGTVTLNGSLLANGSASLQDWTSAGGGAGGGIYISCRTLAGTSAVLQAKGGRGEHGASNGGGGGAGGRIAVWRMTETATTSTWSIAVDGATGWVYGATGTVYWGWIPIAKGTVFRIR